MRTTITRCIALFCFSSTSLAVAEPIPESCWAADKQYLQVTPPKILLKELVKQDEREGLSSEREWQAVGPQLYYKIQGIDLNGDGRYEFVVEDADEPPMNADGEPTQSRGGTNQKLRIATIANNKLTIIFDNYTEQGSITMRPIEKMSEGYRSICTIQHISATAHLLTVYRFSNGQYRSQSCWIESYEEEQDNEKPTTKTAECENLPN